jgi:flavin reductase (DIM6/NTAB) family NADH-FMN oxidoreductase RutF
MWNVCNSYDIIKESKKFVINLVNDKIVRAADWCGVRSGKDNNKWDATGLTPMENEYISAPIIAESPLSICCKVRQIVELGSHDMFIADVVGILADKRYIDSETGKFTLEKAHPIVYSHGEYFSLGKMLGHFGWSVKKKTTKRKK